MRLPAPSVFKAAPARLSGSSSMFWSEWQDSNLRLPAPKAGRLATDLHSETGCGRRTRTVSPAYEAGVLPLHHLRKFLAPQVRIERTTT